MKVQRLIVAMAVLLCCGCSVLVAACGGEETSTTVGPAQETSTSAPSTTAAAASTTTLRDKAAYAADVQAWFDKYNPQFKQGSETILGPVFDDPLNVSEQQLQDLTDFAAFVDEAAQAFAKIQPTPELASAHADYLQTLQSMASGLKQLVEPIKNKDVNAMETVLAPLSAATEKGTIAWDTLTKELNITLPTDSATSTTAGPAQ